MRSRVSQNEVGVTMASLYKITGKTGTLWTVEFIGPQGRKRIRFGKLGRRKAEKAKGHIEALVIAVQTGDPPDAETTQWVNDRDDDTREKLAIAGLIEP